MIKKKYLAKRNTNTAAHITKSMPTIGPTTAPIFVLVFSCCFDGCMVSMNKLKYSNWYILQRKVPKELEFYLVLVFLCTDWIREYTGFLKSKSSYSQSNKCYFFKKNPKYLYSIPKKYTDYINYPIFTRFA